MAKAESIQAQAAQLATRTADALRLGWLLLGASLLLDWAAWRGDTSAANVVIVLIAIAGGAGVFWYGARALFDARVFRQWARHWHDGADVMQTLIDFDARVGRAKPRSADVLTELAGRRAGALGLLRRQALCLLVQLLATAWALWP
ncbi:hypothetical protein [Nitrogeniibacter aestuarii]|uniref:hypothetical protein n=1 Tax=Nitrogeniibacter aestuarii TaxID=2815343 RepID=UPI001D10E67B|nr:hypothetical protein [Nitrogeniibacter aestuarii]